MCIKNILSSLNFIDIAKSVEFKRKTLFPHQESGWNNRIAKETDFFKKLLKINFVPETIVYKPLTVEIC